MLFCSWPKLAKKQAYLHKMHSPTSPNHPQRMWRTGCQSELFYNTPIGQVAPEKLFPTELRLRIYCHTLVSWIPRAVGELEFLLKVDMIGCFEDIYDGNLLSSYANRSNLNDYLSLFLALNVDWFQPSTHAKYSYGAMYMLVANLLRDIWFRYHCFWLWMLTSFSPLHSK